MLRFTYLLRKEVTMYFVYHINRLVQSFTTRDAALDFVYSRDDYGDYEILDNSDFAV